MAVSPKGRFVLTLVAGMLIGSAVTVSLRPNHDIAPVTTTYEQKWPAPSPAEAPIREAEVPTMIVNKRPYLLDEIDVSSFSDDDKSVLFSSLPQGHLTQVLHLADDNFAVAMRDEGSTSSAWFIDASQKQALRLIDDVSSAWDNGIVLSSWSDGVAVTALLTPGEAVSTYVVSYFNSRGIFQASSETGDFNRNGATAALAWGSKKHAVELKHEGACVWPKGATPYENEERTPKVRLTGMVIDGQIFPVPRPIEVPCPLGYGDDLHDPELPKPRFDGTSFTFALPGFDAVVSSTGRATFVPAKP